MKKYLLICLFLWPVQVFSATRIVSVGGAITEIIYALQAEAALVGCDTTSYYPEMAKTLPQIGYQRALSIEGILSLNPDLVIATEEAGPPHIFKQLETANIEVLKVKASRSIEDIKQAINLIAKKLNKEEAAKSLLLKIESEEQELQNMINKNPLHLKALFLMQHGGGALMAAGAGTAADHILSLAGLENVVVAYQGYKTISPEAMIQLQPDVIFVTHQTLEQIGGKEALYKIPGIALTPAAKKDFVMAMDALLMLGFGPRTLEAVQEMYQACQAR